MSQIDNIKIDKDKTKTDLDETVIKLETIHSQLDSVDTAEQKTIPKPGPEEIVRMDPVPKEDVIPKNVPEVTNEKIGDDLHKFTPKQREGKIKYHLSKLSSTSNLKRKEKRMIKDGEYDAVGGNLRELVIAISVIGLILVVVLKNFLPNDAMFALLIIIGATTFLPIGMVMGWLLFDPVMRCKVLRKTTKRNYGVIQFVGQGGKMFPKIKNFDNSLIWRNNECWVLAESRVYQQTKDGNAINNGKEIDAKNIVTYVDTVPVMFLDTHSMAPMKLTNEGDTSVYPVEIGSSLKAWVDNQRAKMMAVKKMEDQITLIIIGACVCAVIVGVITYMKVEEMSETITSLREQMQFIIDGINTNLP